MECIKTVSAASMVYFSSPAIEATPSGTFYMTHWHYTCCVSVIEDIIKLNPGPTRESGGNWHVFMDAATALSFIKPCWQLFLVCVYPSANSVTLQSDFVPYYRVSLTSKSSSASIWLCRVGIPFNSFSTDMVLITPSALREAEGDKEIIK